MMVAVAQGGGGVQERRIVGEGARAGVGVGEFSGGGYDGYGYYDRRYDSRYNRRLSEEQTPSGPSPDSPRRDYYDHQR